MDERQKGINEAANEKGRFFSRLKAGLQKTRDSLTDGIDRVVNGPAEIGPELWQELEELLLVSDMGSSVMTWVMEELKKSVRESLIREKKEIIKLLKELLICILEEAKVNEVLSTKDPCVVLIVGVNGSGKTTTLGKLAAMYKKRGERVMVVAGDTFRAAATEQLQAWADQIDVPCVSQKSGADPSAIAYDATQSALVRKMDRVFVDTAGRLQTNKNLMEELKKIKRVVGKVIDNAPHETLLVLDASIGQNSLSQAKLFNETLGIDGLVMTKLDGSAKGGILFNIIRELKVPVRFVGIGEKVDDLQVFDPRAFVDALFD
jgi:fused signal recognition particle receptor